MANEFIARKGIKSLGGVNFPTKTVSSNTNIGVDDYLVDVSSGTIQVTLPTAVGISGKIYIIKNSGTGLVTVATSSSQTIDGATTKSLSQYESIEVQSDGSNWVIIAGIGSSVVSSAVKSDFVAPEGWGGLPLNTSILFSIPFPNSNYSVVVTGSNARVFTIENLTSSGFTINSNSNTSIAGNTYWVASLNV